jgi:hypothetical protein
MATLLGVKLEGSTPNPNGVAAKRIFHSSVMMREDTQDLPDLVNLALVMRFTRA